MSMIDSKERDLEAAFSQVAKRLETKLMLLEFLNKKQVSDLAKVRASLTIYSEKLPDLRLYDEKIPIHEHLLRAFADKIHELPLQTSFESTSSSKSSELGSASALQMLTSQLNTSGSANLQGDVQKMKEVGPRHQNNHTANSNATRGVIRSNNISTRNAIESTEMSSELTSVGGTSRELMSGIISSNRKQQSPNKSPTRFQDGSPNSRKEINAAETISKTKQSIPLNGKRISEFPPEKNNSKRPSILGKGQQTAEKRIPRRSLSPVLENIATIAEKVSLESKKNSREKSISRDGSEGSPKKSKNEKDSIIPKLRGNKDNANSQKILSQQKRKSVSDLRADPNSFSNSEAANQTGSAARSQYQKSNEVSTPSSSKRNALLNQSSPTKQADRRQSLISKSNAAEDKPKKSLRERSVSLVKSPKDKQESKKPTATISTEKRIKVTKSADSSPQKNKKKKKTQNKKQLQISAKTTFTDHSQTPSPSFGGGRVVTISANETLGFDQEPIPHVQGGENFTIKLKPASNNEKLEAILKQQNQEGNNKAGGTHHMDNLLADLMGDSFEKYREPMFDDSPFSGGKNQADHEDTFSNLLVNSVDSQTVQQEDVTQSSRPFSPTNKSETDKNSDTKRSQRRVSQRAKSETLKAPKNLGGKRKSFVFGNIRQTTEEPSGSKIQSEPNQLITEADDNLRPDQMGNLIEEEKTFGENNNYQRIRANTVPNQSEGMPKLHNQKLFEGIAKLNGQKINNSPEFLNSHSKNADNSTKEMYFSTQQSKSQDADKPAEHLMDRVFGTLTSQIVYPQTEPTECLSHHNFESLGKVESKRPIDPKLFLKIESNYHSEKVLSKRSSLGVIESNVQNLLDGIEQQKISKLLDEFGHKNTEEFQERSQRELETTEQLPTDPETDLIDPRENVFTPEELSAARVPENKVRKSRKSKLNNFKRYSSTQTHTNVSSEVNSAPISAYASESRKDKNKKTQKKSKTTPKKDTNVEPYTKKLTATNPASKPVKKSKSAGPAKSKKSKQKQPTNLLQVLSPEAWSILHESSSCIDQHHINYNLEKQQEALKKYTSTEDHLKSPPVKRVRPEIPLLRTDKIKPQYPPEKQTSVSNQSQKVPPLTSEQSLALLSNADDHLHHHEKEVEEEEKKHDENLEFPEMSHIENLESEEQSASWYEEISLGMQKDPFSACGSEMQTQELSNPKKLFTSDVMKEIEKGIEIEVLAEKNSIAEKMNLITLSNLTDRSVACKSEILKGWNSNQMHSDSKGASSDSLAIRKHSVEGNLLVEKKSNFRNTDNSKSFNKSQKSSRKHTEESLSHHSEHVSQELEVDQKAIEQLHTEEGEDYLPESEMNSGEKASSKLEGQSDEIIEQPEKLLRPEEEPEKMSELVAISDKDSLHNSQQGIGDQIKTNLLEPHKWIESSNNVNSVKLSLKSGEYLKGSEQMSYSSAVTDSQKEKEKGPSRVSSEVLLKQIELLIESRKSSLKVPLSIQQSYSENESSHHKTHNITEQLLHSDSNQRSKYHSLDKGFEDVPIIQYNSVIQNAGLNQPSEKEPLMTVQTFRPTNHPDISKNPIVKASISTQTYIDKIDREIQTLLTELHNKSCQTSPIKVDRAIQILFTKLHDKSCQTSPTVQESPEKKILFPPQTRNSEQETGTKKLNSAIIEDLLNRAKARRALNFDDPQIQNQDQIYSHFTTQAYHLNGSSDKQKIKCEGSNPRFPAYPSEFVSGIRGPTEMSLTPTNQMLPSKNYIQIEKPKESRFIANSPTDHSKDRHFWPLNRQGTARIELSETVETSTKLTQPKTSLERTMAFAREFFKNEAIVKLSREPRGGRAHLLEVKDEWQTYKVIPLNKRQLTSEFQSKQKFSAPKNRSFH